MLPIRKTALMRNTIGTAEKMNPRGTAIMNARKTMAGKITVIAVKIPVTMTNV
jgi:hypothetical protein